MSTRYTIRQDEVIVDANLCVPGQEVISVVLCQQRGSYITSLAGYSIRLDRRNDPIRPTGGFYVDLTQDIAGIGGDVHYVRTEADGGWFFGFSRSFILQLTGSIGYVEGWNGDTVRISDRFYKGGNSFRGFETAGLGPRDTQFGDALGGKLYIIGSAELSLPNFLPEQYGIRTALFTDFGTVGLLDRDARIDPNTNLPISTVRDELSLRASVGFSVLWRSPMGPLRFDFSQVLAREDYDKTESFRFSTAARF
jgi:outer membrane protein insertion porin family